MESAYPKKLRISSLPNYLDLKKCFIKANSEIARRVVVKSHGSKEKVEITIPTKFLVLRSEVEADDVLDAIDIAKEKLESQIRKVKTKLDRTNSKTNLGKLLYSMKFYPKMKKKKMYLFVQKRFVQRL